MNTEDFGNVADAYWQLSWTSATIFFNNRPFKCPVLNADN